MPRPFIICFVARSGSGALMFDLDQHPQVRMAAEAMGGAALPRGATQTDDNRLEWLRRWWKGGRRASGFKFQFNPGEPQFNDLPRLAAAIREREAVVFRLGRRDRVRHAISALRAQVLMPIAGGMGHIRTDDPAEMQAFRERPVHLAPEAFRQMVVGIEANARYMDGFLAGLTAVPIFYEDYQAARLGVLNTIASAVEVEPFTEAPPETIRKVSPDDLRQAVANYDEVAAVAAELGLRA